MPHTGRGKRKAVHANKLTTNTSDAETLVSITERQRSASDDDFNERLAAALAAEEATLKMLHSELEDRPE
jgi:hypothetical protein